MGYSFMRVMLMFDLPVQTKKQRRVYSNFRKYLIKKGYIMLQFSVYVKLLNNRDSAVQHIHVIKKNLPQEGQVRILMLTEKQYARMEVVLGGKSRQEKIITIDPFMLV